jgi:hypothetical protein
MPTYCVYQAQQSSPHTNPKIQIGDTFCVTCPEDGLCKGTQGQPKGVKIKDAAGNEVTINAVLQNPECVSCPEGGHTGFTFAPKNGGNGW